MSAVDNAVQSYYQNVLHNTNRATRRHDRDGTEFEAPLIAAALRARAHRAEEEESKGPGNEEEKEKALKPYQLEEIHRSLLQAGQESMLYDGQRSALALGFGPEVMEALLSPPGDHAVSGADEEPAAL